MNSNQFTATSAVFSQLKAAETARDASVRSDSELITTMIEARQHAKLRFGEGQVALEHATRSLVAGVEARGHLVRTHERLARLATARRFDWTALGDEGDTEPDFMPNTGQGAAKVVTA